MFDLTTIIPRQKLLAFGRPLFLSITAILQRGKYFWESERTPLYQPCCSKSPGKRGLRWANMQTAIVSKQFGPSEVPATVHAYSVAIEPTCKPVLNTWKAIYQNLTPSRLPKTGHPSAWLRALPECYTRSFNTLLHFASFHIIHVQAIRKYWHWK